MDNERMTSAELLERQREFFRSGRTLELSYRKDALHRLYKAVSERSTLLTDALTADLGKSETEGFLCEAGLTLTEIRCQLRHLRRWAAPKRKPTSLVNSFAASYILREPLGSVLVMAPWNYPVLLSLEPLVGAVAAGNTVILKPSAYAPHSSRVLADLVSSVFPPEYVAVVEGGRQANSDLLDLPFDHIFFTGSVAVGRVVMERAAKNLTPVTLELGGKSPVIVEKTADISMAAKRIVFGKLLNAGQTCIAPDYILAERPIHDALLEELKKQFAIQCPEPMGNAFTHIVNEKHFDRVLGLIDPEKCVFGGGADRNTLHIEPTILDGVAASDAVMQQEIFGPILPILTVDSMAEAEEFIRARPKPLALYVFTNDRAAADRFTRHVSSGGACVNDTISHILASNLPFGGVGNSGMGQYHGEYSFRTFSHEKAVVRKILHPDMPMRYTPYKKEYDGLVRRMLR